MLRVTLRSLWAHKRRLISTVVAIVLGVAFMAGTFVLTDTLDRVFDDLFADFGKETDAQVQGTVLFEDPFMGDQRAPLDSSLLDQVAGVDGVASAAPVVTTVGAGSTNRVLGADGDPVGAAQGPPTLLENWTDDPGLSSYELVQGRGPEADDEIALNTAAADDGDLSVGDDVVVVTQFGRSTYTLVGIFNFGTAESAAGAVSADFTLAEAQRIAGLDGRVQQIVARADDGLSQQQLVDRIAAALPNDVEVITGEQAAADLSSDVQSGFSFFKQILLIFGGIALLVGVFVISNTFSILVAQRTRELALLRAIGAGRTQVLTSMLVEAVLVGLVSAIFGLLAGVGLAKGVTALLDAAGADLPTTSLVVRGSTVLFALVVGVLVTLVAAVIPAIRATRVPPLAALREVAIDRSGASRLRLALAVVVLALGAFNLSAAWTADGDTDAVPGVGVGALLIILGVIIVGPLIAGPAVRGIGVWLPRLKGVTGHLARENAARSPKRTSATASALTIGVALVAFITVFAASAKDSVTAEVQRGFTGDFVVQTDAGGFGGFGGFPATVADEVAAVDGVDVVVALGFSQAELTYPDGKTATQFVTSVDPENFTQVLEPRMTAGDVTDLTDDGIIVDVQAADDHGVEVGDTMRLTLVGGAQLDLRVEAISDDQSLLGAFTITRATYADAVPEHQDIQVFGSIDDGADLDQVMTAVEAATASTPALQVLDRDGFIGTLASQITAFVTVIYALLILSIIIAMIGIANTLSLSIHERTRELGLLRAVGMDRRQLRSSVRWEAVLMSLLGAAIGIALGIGLSYALVTALEGFGLSRFALPGGSVVTIVLLAAVLGVLASVRPARRAARLAILDAIAEE